MRVVGGKFRGRSLAAPETNAIRPTTDRTRESLFNILQHNYPEKFESTRVLDLFAGTGALGLEAISRGARYGIFIEESAQGRGLIRTNIEAFGLMGATKVFSRDATKLGDAGNMEPFDLVFADPPYGKSLGEMAFKAALDGGWLKPDSLLILEEESEAVINLDPRFEIVEERSYGGSIIRLVTLKS